jgi:hypothetical protein
MTAAGWTAPKLVCSWTAAVDVSSQGCSDLLVSYLGASGTRATVGMDASGDAVFSVTSGLDTFCSFYLGDTGKEQEGSC